MIMKIPYRKRLNVKIKLCVHLVLLMPSKMLLECSVDKKSVAVTLIETIMTIKNVPRML